MRKVLSFVLVLSLVLGSFSMAFAATPATGLSDIDGIANEEAIQVSYDLGIVTGNPDGTFLPEKTVTRAEFAAMITRALAVPESALAGYSATTFKDTVGYGWAVPYLGFANSKGIMLGDGAGNAMPGRTISVNEAVTMALRAIGYTNNSSELVGTWPSNYVTLAQNAGLYDDVAAVANVDKASAAQIIYNLLTVQKVAVNSDGETKDLTTGSPAVAANLLNTGLGATAWTTAKLIVGTEDSAINLLPYVGASVIAYEKDDEIIAIGSVESDFLTVDSVVTGSTTKFKTAEGTEYTLPASVATGYAVYVNGDQEFTTTNVAVTLAAGQKFAVDLTGKTVEKLYSVATWDATGNTEVVDAADLAALDDHELLGIAFPEDDDDNIDFNKFELVGVASLDKIAKDNVVYVYVNNATEIAKVAVGTTIVEGKVTDIDGTKYTVAGTTYKFSTYATADRPEAGDTIKAYLDAYGKIFEYDTIDSTPDTYAVVAGYDYKIASSIDDTRLKLYTSEDKTTTFTVDDDAVVTTGNAIASTTMPATLAVRTLVGYGLDKDGVIDTVNGKAITEAGLNLDSPKILDVAAGTLPMASDAVVFTWDGTDYAIVNIADVELNQDLGGASVANASYIVDDGKVVALLIDASDADKSSDDVYAVVNNYTTVYDADLDDTVNRLIGFAGGAAFDKKTNDAYTLGGTYATAVALYTVTTDADGYIKTAVATTAAFTGSIQDLANDNLTVKVGGSWYEIAATAVVYQATDNGTTDIAYKVSGVSTLRATSAATTYTIWLYETDDDVDGYDVVIFTK